MAVCATRLPEKLLKSWDSKGKEDALGLFQKTYRQGSQPCLEGSVEFRSLVYDLCKHGVCGGLDNEDISAFLVELGTSLGIVESLQSVVADVLSILDAEVACGDSKEQRSAFKALTSACMSFFGDGLLKERLDMETLEGLGLVASRTTFNQKYVKMKTKLFYKQQKFNLFREENEGYSKLIAELGYEGRLDGAAPNVLEHVKSLIGRFNLDPNRVLDVMLEAFESHLDEAGFFVSLLSSYPCQPLTFVNILGFKFQCYHSSEFGDPFKALPTPASLCTMTALLLRSGLVKLEDLVPHLSFPDVPLKEFHSSEFEEARKQARRATVLALNDKTDEEREKELEAEKARKEYRATVISIEANQKLGLCRALLELGDWHGARALMQLLPHGLPMWCPPIVKSLCTLVEVSIRPLYSMCCPRAAKGSLSLPASLEGVQQCSRFEEMCPDVFEMLYCLGPRLHASPVLLAKLLRIGKVVFKERSAVIASGELPSQDREDVFHGLISVLDETLLPSLALMQCNCAMAEEVWSMVRQLPYETRYQLYGHWKNSSYDLHTELIDVRCQVLQRGRYIMKRLTKENVKPSGRQIGKHSHCNPGIIFDYVLSQIQRYDNFIIPVVDSLKYLTPLAYDVLAFCIIEALGNPQRERMKHDDTNISNWLKGLASFSANVFKKYPIELTGVLQYVANQLKAGKSFDLIVLKEVIQKMSGIDISEQMTQSQLEAMAGGELLKAEGGYFLQVRNTKKSSQRLRDALVDGRLSLPLCLLMAQQRDCIIFKEGAQQHLKLTGMLYDYCLDTLIQFGWFLSSHFTSEEYSSRIPSLDALGTQYHISVDVAFFLLRPPLSNSIRVKFQELEAAEKSEGRKLDKKKSQHQEASYQKACQSVMEPVMDVVRLLHPARVWDDISVRLYTVFWSLSVYDLYVPKQRYDEEAKKAQQAIQQLEDNYELSSSKRKKEQERCQALMEKLREERQVQESNNRLVLAWLSQEKDHWFSAKVTKNRTITQFLQLCVYPRCRFTSSDALFSAKFVKMLHSLQAPNFSTLLFFDRVFSDISYTVVCCTENEVMRYGRFLGALLEVVSHWHSSESVYAQECAKTPGFISMMRSSGAGNEKQYLDYENYRHITFKWHFKLTKSLVVLLESKDYMQVRNGLYVLTKVLPHYPKVYHLSIALEKRVEKIMEEEKDKRQDLYVLAMGYFSMLKTQKANLVPESEFHNREERVKAQQSEGEAKPTSTSKSETVASNGIAGPAEEKPAKVPKGKAKEEKTPKGKSDEVKVRARETAGPEPAAKEKRHKEESPSLPKAKQEAAVPEKPSVRTPREKTASAGGGKGSVTKDGVATVATVTVAGSPGQRELPPTAKVGLKSPLGLNGPTTASPGRTGQRRQHSGTVSPVDGASEKETKRRKLEDGASKTKTDERPPRDKEGGADEEKRSRADRKRERSSDKEGSSEPKKKRDSPESAAAEPPDAKEKVASRRLVKVNKKEGKVTLDVSTVAPKRGATQPAADEDSKLKKHHSAKVKIAAKK